MNKTAVQIRDERIVFRALPENSPTKLVIDGTENWFMRQGIDVLKLYTNVGCSWNYYTTL